ncbi:MAG: hypothetical protein UY50_C0005G0012 [Parcubacteria group bacterium GW2011_GWA2_49_9]|nr:MAG: hypothetical protein UY50_C0005G0012 [Parcubacteria group bacterium GW2011_GWA2_49_9]
MPPYKPTLGAVLREALRGKAVSRTLTNLFWRGRVVLSGQVLDIGGGSQGSHYRFLKKDETLSLKVADIIPRAGTDFVLNIEEQQVPLPAGSQNIVLMFNILEHLFKHDRVLEEVKRLLVPGGLFIGTIPFLINVHPDPHDYVRFTREALESLFLQHGFTVRVIEPIGRGPFLAGYEQLDMLIWSPLHLVFLPIVWCLDGLIQRVKPSRDFKAQFPLAYNFIVEKRV